MAENTGIIWADHTFNSWEGCTKVSPGCDNCYAEARNKRFSKGKNWGKGAPRRRTEPANWRKPIIWNDQDFYECGACGYRGSSREIDKLSSGKCCPAPEFHLTRARVFCASLADVFDNEVDPQWRFDLFELIKKTPNLDWLLLTKRIGNVETMAYYANHVGGPAGLPDNVWLGATFVNQDEFDRDIRKLLAIPARIHFGSFEPLLGPIDMLFTDHSDGMIVEKMHALDWLIAGGENGPRPMDPDWPRSLRDHCKQFGVPFLFKQWGKQKAGRELDGKTYTEFPA